MVGYKRECEHTSELHWKNCAECREFLVRQNIGESEEKLLCDYSTWLSKHGYLDSDWYTEEPQAVEEFLSTRKKII